MTKGVFGVPEDAMHVFPYDVFQAVDAAHAVRQFHKAKRDYAARVHDSPTQRRDREALAGSAGLEHIDLTMRFNVPVRDRRQAAEVRYAAFDVLVLLTLEAFRKVAGAVAPHRVARTLQANRSVSAKATNSKPSGFHETDAAEIPLQSENTSVIAVAHGMPIGGGTWTPESGERFFDREPLAGNAALDEVETELEVRVRYRRPVEVAAAGPVVTWWVRLRIGLSSSDLGRGLSASSPVTRLRGGGTGETHRDGA